MKIWIVQLVNYTLALFMWLIIGRYILVFLTGGKKGFMMDFFERFTNPLYHVTKRVFPFLRERFIPLATIILIILIRISVMVIFKPLDKGGG